MSELHKGILKFKNEDFETHKDLFRKLSEDQAPHTLFIGCSDSRVVPHLITKTLPGEIFVARNIANFVPPFRSLNEHFATTSAIEYAVQVLNVDNIVVCGHSNCGGCGALYAEEHELDYTPHVRKWLELGQNVKEKVLADFPDEGPEKRAWHTEQLNVVQQVENLLTYPFIQTRHKHGKLNIMGWYYIIETGEVFQYSEDTKTFELIQS